MAKEPTNLEFVVRIYENDPNKLAYAQLQDKLGFLGVPVKLILHEEDGYENLCLYHEQCYKASTGHLLLLAGDDCRVLTLYWDEVYRSSLGPYCVSPAIFAKEGDTYPWAFPCVDRRLCEAIGKFCILTPRQGNDRVFEAYAKLSGLTCQPRVYFYHAGVPYTPGTGRGDWNKYANDHWAELSAQWHKDARAMWEAVKV